MREAEGFSRFETAVPLQFSDCGESALLVDFSAEADPLRHILSVAGALTSAHIEGLVDCVPGTASLTLVYDPLTLARTELTRRVRETCGCPDDARLAERVWTVPVCYGASFGIDLETAGEAAGLTAAQLAGLHCSRIYPVLMLGFLPGFAYIGEMPAPLRLPRRPIPRQSVSAGSVAIAAGMTAIYPVESPGGWHIIGRTPVRLWDLPQMPEPLLQPGDGVRFRAIGTLDFAILQAKVAEGWRPEPDAL